MELTRDTARSARPRIACQCGERVHIPQWTEYHNSGRIRHLWECDACGCSFETTVHVDAVAKTA
jgi:hypothetical protein